MSKTVKRGYVPTDEKEFIKQIDRLKSAGVTNYKQSSIFLKN